MSRPACVLGGPAVIALRRPTSQPQFFVRIQFLPAYLVCPLASRQIRETPKSCDPGVSLDKSRMGVQNSGRPRKQPRPEEIREDPSTIPRPTAS